jgi:GEVED domain/Secretion system C-terminal sorting domain/Fibronectin type III domain
MYGTTEWTVVPCISESIELQGLNALRSYEWQVQTVCGISSSAFVSGTVFTPSNSPYCLSMGRTGIHGYIDGVSFSGKGFINRSGDDNGYGDYAGSHKDELILTKGEVVNFMLSAGRYHYSSPPPAYWKIWIDLNHDGDFSDIDELMYDSGESLSQTISGNFTVPATANVNSTGMRISMKFEAAQTECEVFRFGEVEDYSVSINSCVSPSGLAIQNVTSNSARMSFILPMEGSTYRARYRRFGTVEWSIPQYNNSLTELSPSTAYEWQVQAVCTNEYSSFVPGPMFTTPAAAYCPSRGLYAGEEWIDAVALDGYLIRSGPNDGYGDFTSQTWTIKKGEYVHCALTPGFKGSNFPERWRIWIDLNGDKDYDDAEELVYSSERGFTGKVECIIMVPTTATATRTRMRVSMAYGHSPNACGDFNIGEVEDYDLYLRSACGIPSGLATGISPSPSSVKLSWQAVPGANSYNVHYREVGTTTYNILSTPVASADLSGLSSEKTYEWRVETYCDAGHSASVPGPDFSPTYCSSRGPVTTDSWIASLTIGSRTNTSLHNGGYGDYTATDVQIVRGMPTPFLLTPRFTRNGLFYWKIWIDLNGDEDFSDEGELVYNSGGGYDRSRSGSFTVPATATATRTRMRVSMQRDVAPAECGLLGNGEVEDYGVLLSSCGSFTGFRTSEVTSSEVTLSWNAIPGATEYNLQYREINTTAWNYANSTLSVVKINGLKASTAYEWQVQSFCGSEASSHVSAPNFTTSAAYCSSTGRFTMDEWIESVAIGGSYVNTSGDNGGYRHFNPADLKLTTGVATTFTLTPGYRSAAYPEYWRIWIDINGDKDFSDADELVYESEIAIDGPHTGIFTIPFTESTTTRPTRMRISMRDYFLQTECDSFNNGEVEDYDVTLMYNCVPPTGLETRYDFEHQVTTLVWSRNESASSYELQYRVVGAADWTTVNTGSYFFHNIPFETMQKLYEWRVKSVCAVGANTSSYVEGPNFITEEYCFDKYEYNDNASDAKPVNANTSIFAKICHERDLDYYKFHTSSEKPDFTITLSQLPADYDLYLYSGTENDLIGWSSATGLGDEKIVYSSAESGLYTVMVSSDQGSYSSSRDYQLFITTYDGPDQPNQWISQYRMQGESGESAATSPDILEVWPNPVSRNLSVGYRSNTEDAARMMVMDLSGRMVASRRVNLVAGANTLELDVSTLADGMYIVRVQTDTQSHSAKVQVMK